VARFTLKTLGTIAVQCWVLIVHYLDRLLGLQRGQPMILTSYLEKNTERWQVSAVPNLCDKSLRWALEPCELEFLFNLNTPLRYVIILFAPALTVTTATSELVSYGAIENPGSGGCEGLAMPRPPRARDLEHKWKPVIPTHSLLLFVNFYASWH